MRHLINKIFQTILFNKKKKIYCKEAKRKKNMHNQLKRNINQNSMKKNFKHLEKKLIFQQL